MKVHNMMQLIGKTPLLECRALKKKLGLPVNLLDAGPRPSLWMDCQKAKSAGIGFSNAVGGLTQCIQDYHLKG